MHLRQKSRFSSCLFLILVLSGCATGGVGPGQRAEAPGGRAAAAGELSLEARDRLLEQGYALLDGGDARAARTRFAQVLELSPEDPHALLAMAETQLQSRSYEEAIAAFGRLAAVPEVQARAWQGQGISLLLLGKTEAAAGPLSAAVEADPSLWRAWNALGQFHDRQKRWDLARRDYDGALAAGGPRGVVLNNRGMSYLQQDRPHEAALSFREAIEADPALDVADRNYRLALARKGAYSDALAGVPSKEQAAMLYNVGYVALSNGELQIAEGYLARAIRESPAYYAKAVTTLEYLRSLDPAAGTTGGGGRRQVPVS